MTHRLWDMHRALNRHFSEHALTKRISSKWAKHSKSSSWPSAKKQARVIAAKCGCRLASLMKYPNTWMAKRSFVFKAPTSSATTLQSAESSNEYSSPILTSSPILIFQDRYRNPLSPSLMQRESSSYLSINLISKTGVLSELETIISSKHSVTSENSECSSKTRTTHLFA